MKIIRSGLYRLLVLLLASRLLNRVAERMLIFLLRLYWHFKLPAIKRNNNSKPRLVWGSTPIINNKYFSKAMMESGYVSVTIMQDVYAINKRDDFDRYLNEYPESLKGNVFLSLILAKLPNLNKMLTLNQVVHDFDIVHLPSEGGFLFRSPYWKLESYVYKKAGVKTVVLPYGGDYYRYSKIEDVFVRHGIQLSYPKGYQQEKEIDNMVQHWVQNADCFIPAHMIDGIARWDVLPFSILSIDSASFKPKLHYSNADGLNASVKVIHTPNHRGVKGTEFLIKAVNELKNEGLKIELILLENVPNQEVMRLMREEADILAEQFVFSAYAMSGIEGMVSGLPVMTNLEISHYTRIFRLYSYLNECPILSTPIEDIKKNLRLLIRNPELREQLGRAGRSYVEKYHSYATSQFMFGNIYKKIWHNQEVDLINLFHPALENSYNKTLPQINHPLVENKLQAHHLNKLNK